MTEAAHPLIGRTFTNEERINLRLPLALAIAEQELRPTDFTNGNPRPNVFARTVLYELVRIEHHSKRGDSFRYERVDQKLHETREALRTILDLYLGLSDSELSKCGYREILLSEEVQTARRLLNLPPFTGDEP